MKLQRVFARWPFGGRKTNRVTCVTVWEFKYVGDWLITKNRLENVHETLTSLCSELRCCVDAVFCIFGHTVCVSVELLYTAIVARKCACDCQR